MELKYDAYVHELQKLFFFEKILEKVRARIQERNPQMAEMARVGPD